MTRHLTSLNHRLSRDLGVARSLIVYWRPGRQRGLKRLYADFAGPGDLAFDVGAHLGDRTAAFAALGASVVSLEPQPHLYRWLTRLLGHRAQVTLLSCAAGAQAGEATLAMSRTHPTVSTLATHWRETIGQSNRGFRSVRWEDEIRVPVTSLDALIAEHGLPRFCKIDVEGFEDEVLAGLSQPVEAVSVEFVAGSLEVAKRCIARLSTLGEYRFNAIAGEQRRFLWPDWCSADSASRWLTEGASGLASGDLYARLASAPPLPSHHQEPSR